MASIVVPSHLTASKAAKADVGVSTREIKLEEEKTTHNISAKPKDTKPSKSFLDEVAIFVKAHKKHMIEYERALADLEKNKNELHATKERADKTARHLDQTKAELREKDEQLYKTAEHLHHARAELRNLKEESRKQLEKHYTTVTFNEQVVTSWGESVFIVGNIPQLGNWDTNKAVALSASQYNNGNPLWSVSVELPADVTIEYKYIKKEANGKIVWEGDLNRQYVIQRTPSNKTTESNSWR